MNRVFAAFKKSSIVVQSVKRINIRRPEVTRNKNGCFLKKLCWYIDFLIIIHLFNRINSPLQRLATCHFVNTIVIGQLTKTIQLKIIFNNRKDVLERFMEADGDRVGNDNLKVEIPDLSLTLW